MTTFFTVLILSYQVQGQELQARWVYESAAECSQAIAAAEALVPNALAVTCQQSGMISYAPRPPLRPMDNSVQGDS